MRMNLSVSLCRKAAPCFNKSNFALQIFSFFCTVTSGNVIILFPTKLAILLNICCSGSICSVPRPSTKVAENACAVLEIRCIKVFLFFFSFSGRSHDFEVVRLCARLHLTVGATTPVAYLLGAASGAVVGMKPQDLRHTSTKVQRVTCSRIVLPDIVDSPDALRWFGTECGTGDMAA